MDKLTALKKSIPKIDPTVLVVGGIGVFAAFYLLRSTGLFGETPQEAKKRKAEAGQVTDEMSELKKKNIHPTYSDSQYSSAADSIYNFLRYSGISDDASGAENVLNRHLYNDADFLKLLAAYGKRNLTPFGIPVGGAIGLSATLTDQFSSTRLSKVNALLKSRGLTYQF